MPRAVALLAGTSPTGGGSEGGGGGVSALLVFALNKLEKSRDSNTEDGTCLGVGEDLIREVLVALFHRSARPMAVLRALLVLVDREGRLGPLVEYCEETAGIGEKGGAVHEGSLDGRKRLTVQERCLAEGLLGEGGGMELRKAAWAVWASGGKGGLLSLIKGAEHCGDGVKMMERVVQAMPWQVLLSQAVMAGVGFCVLRMLGLLAGGHPRVPLYNLCRSRAAGLDCAGYSRQF